MGNKVNRSLLQTVAIIIFGIFLTVRWLMVAKGTPYRRDVLFTGISFLVAVIAFTLGHYMHSALLSLLGFLAFFGFWVFLIRAVVAERRFKKVSSQR